MPTHSGYVTANEIIADVTTMVDDEGFKKFSLGFYMSYVQQALSDLAFDSYFDERVWTTPITSLCLDMPSGMFSIDDVFVFNGDECDANNVQTVYWGKNHYNHGGAWFRKQRGDNGNDPLTEDAVSTTTAATTLFYNTYEGQIHLSDACGSWEMLMVKYKGMGVTFGDVPLIPHELRTAIKNRVAMDVIAIMYSRDPQRWIGPLQMIKRDHHGGNGPLDVGTWKQAMRRVQSRSKKQIDDLKKYLSNLSDKHLL